MRAKGRIDLPHPKCAFSMRHPMSTLKISLVSSLHKCDARATTAATPRWNLGVQRQRIPSAVIQADSMTCRKQQGKLRKGPLDICKPHESINSLLLCKILGRQERWLIGARGQSLAFQNEQKSRLSLTLATRTTCPWLLENGSLPYFQLLSLHFFL